MIHVRKIEGLHQLSSEIRRIAECPYTPSLKVRGYLRIEMLRIDNLSKTFVEMDRS